MHRIKYPFALGLVVALGSCVAPDSKSGPDVIPINNVDDPNENNLVINDDPENNVVIDDTPISPDWFGIDALMDFGTSPIVIFPGGQQTVAYVRRDTERPVIVIDETEIDIPVSEGSVTKISGITEPNGRVHFALDIDGAIHYIAYDDGSWIPEQKLTDFADDVTARDATIALTPTEVVVAYTTVTEEIQDDVDQIIVRRANLEYLESLGFGQSVVANEGCCESEFGDIAYTVSGPTLATEGERVHIVFEWMAFGFTVVEYVAEESYEVYAAPIQIAEAAFAPCPALTVRDGVAHVTYLLENNDAVWYATVEDGERTEPLEIYRDPEGAIIYLALMIMDRDGAMHLAIKQRSDKERLIYFEAFSANEPIVVAGPENFEGFFTLTPRSGGLAIHNGELFIPFEHAESNDDVGRLKLAIGRAAPDAS